MAIFSRLALAAGLAALHAAASPVAAAVPALVKRYDAGSCNNQSCIVANIAGNTGQPVSITTYPVGSTTQGDCCVITLNPAVKKLAIEYNPDLKKCAPTYTKRSADEPTQGHMLMARHVFEARAAMDDGEFAALEAAETLSKRSCSDKILVYSKGTFEPGPLGVTVGPMLEAALVQYGGWTVRGVSYNPSTDGDYCLGLPGGIAGKELLTRTVAQCPSSKIAMAGYSQGAMVVRNALGNSTVQSRVSGLVTFGDPFDGAKVKHYTGPIQVYCAEGDGVCMGQFDITAAHLSYGVDVPGAAAILEQMVSS